MLTRPSPFESKGTQDLTDPSLKAMLTPLTSSSTVTPPLPLQSPVQGVGVRVGVPVCVRVGLSVAVTVGVPVKVGTGV
jgi:hypothetical protein